MPLINNYHPIKFQQNLANITFFIKKLMQTLQKNPLKKLAHYIILLAKLDERIKPGKLSGKQAITDFSNELKHQI